MPYTPTHRVGPIPESHFGNPDVPLGLSPPAYGLPGGGLEMATREVMWLPGFWSFNPGNWVL
jgi:hypothetical protein